MADTYDDLRSSPMQCSALRKIGFVQSAENKFDDGKQPVKLAS